MDQSIAFPARKAACVALVGLDEATSAVLAECFHQFGVITLKVAKDEVGRFDTEKFDACVLHLDDHAERVLSTARNSPVNFRMVVYGLGSGQKPNPGLLRYGINVMLEEPVEKRTALRAVRATYLLIVHEFRRYVRIPLVTPVKLLFEGRAVSGTSEELSGGGMSIFANRLPPGLNVEVEFAMPNCPQLRVGASVRWAGEGRLGLRFDENDDGRMRVKSWVDKYLGIS
jgi:hypothetical protein